jgi:hypothetical protein
MVAGILGSACVGSADWIWENNDDPLQPSSTRTTRGVDRRVRDIEKTSVRMEKWSKSQQLDFTLLQ